MQHAAVQTDGVHTGTDACTGAVTALGPAACRDSGQQHAANTAASAPDTWTGAAGGEGQEGRRARDSWDGSGAGALVLAPARAASPGPGGQPLLHIAPGSHVSITIHHTLDPGAAGVPASGAGGAAFPALPAACDGEEPAAGAALDAAAGAAECEHCGQQPGCAPITVCADRQTPDQHSCPGCGSSSTSTGAIPALPTHSSTHSYASTSCVSSMGPTHHHHNARGWHESTAVRTSTAPVASFLHGAATQRQQPLPLPGTPAPAAAPQPLPPPLPRCITVDPHAAALRFPEVSVQEVSATMPR